MSQPVFVRSLVPVGLSCSSFKKTEHDARSWFRTQVARRKFIVVFVAWSLFACRVEQHGIALPREIDASTKYHPLRARPSRPFQLFFVPPSDSKKLEHLPLYPLRYFFVHLEPRSQRILVHLSTRSDVYVPTSPTSPASPASPTFPSKPPRSAQPFF